MPRGREMSIFDVFGHLKIFENFGKLVTAKKNYEKLGILLSQIARRIFWR